MIEELRFQNERFGWWVRFENEPLVQESQCCKIFLFHGQQLRDYESCLLGHLQFEAWDPEQFLVGRDRFPELIHVVVNETNVVQYVGLFVFREFVGVVETVE